AVRTEHPFAGPNIHRYRVEDGLAHLARHEALPDKTVKLRLVRLEILRHGLRRALDPGGPDRLVRFLRAAGLGLVERRLCRNKILPIAGLDERARRLLRLRGDVHRIRTHVGDETDGLAGAQVDAFVKALRDAHGPLGAETE